MAYGDGRPKFSAQAKGGLTFTTKTLILHCFSRLLKIHTLKTKQILAVAGGVIILILACMGGCAIGKRTCPSATVEIQRDTIYKLVSDTFNVTTPGETIVLPGRERVRIESDTQLVRLMAETQKKALEHEKMAEYWRASFEALAGAGIGDIIIVEPPHVVKSGTAKSTDGTALIDYKIELYDSTAWVAGDSLHPNPKFLVHGLEMQTSSQFTTDSSKRNAIGIGAMAGSNTALGKIDVGAMLHVRIGKTSVYSGYFVRDKFVVVGASTEVQFGKRK